MSTTQITVLDLLDLNLKGHDSLNLKCIAGRIGLSRELKVPDINRPGLALSGFFESFAPERVQVFGRGEVAYLEKLIKENNIESIKKFFFNGYSRRCLYAFIGSKTNILINCRNCKLSCTSNRFRINGILYKAFARFLKFICS